MSKQTLKVSKMHFSLKTCKVSKNHRSSSREHIIHIANGNFAEFSHDYSN